MNWYKLLLNAVLLPTFVLACSLFFDLAVALLGIKSPFPPRPAVVAEIDFELWQMEQNQGWRLPEVFHKSVDDQATERP
ncbi:MAG: hypothetical protein U1F63_10435 [Chitinivorax sp.]